jgi:hypothetical protein
MIKLSKASKMPCLSWSLQALDTCPGSKSPDGGLVPACQGCYATSGNYRFPSVKAPREHNRQDWERVEWEGEMILAMAKETHFRWFDSGDMYSLALARKILAVMEATPHVRHWLPTRMHKFGKFHQVIAQMQALPNVVVRLSSDSIKGETVPGPTTSTIFGQVSQVPEGATICEAYTRDGKCGPCRACWDKGNAVIAYPAHGQAMLRLIAKGV